MFKGFIIRVLIPSDNQRIYRIKCEHLDEEHIELQELTILITTNQQKDRC